MARFVRAIKMQGHVAYAPMLERQQRLREAVARGEAASTIFLLEHSPVITMGRRADADHVLRDAASLASEGVQLLKTDRGGDVTYHGPGQLVIYPVLDLRLWRPSVDWYLRALEETIIRTLQGFGITGERMENFTGVWVAGAKVAAVGVSIRHWVTGHGLALNVATCPQHWKLIVPCGIRNKPVVNLADLTRHTPTMTEVMKRYLDAFADVFDCEIESDE